MRREVARAGCASARRPCYEEPVAALDIADANEVDDADSAPRGTGPQPNLHDGDMDRRTVLTAPPVRAGTPRDTPSAASLTKAERDRLTPDDVIARMKNGNERFRSGERTAYDYLAQQRASAAGQFPLAVILSCVDSRVPAEIILDFGIGDVLNARVAGNIAGEDVLGSLEFACKVAGAKVALVMGHTACGAVQGAIEELRLGNLTGLLAKIRPAVPATDCDGERSTSNPVFVNAVARTNVDLTVQTIRTRSAVLAELERAGAIKIVSAMYHLETGAVEFFAA
jgi:carbonic anhydrase